jgi:HK97 family phage portal protein
VSLAQRLFGRTFGPTGMRWDFPSITYSGQSVDAEGALSLVPVFNAVSQIAGAVAMMPLLVYERRGEYRDRAEDDHAWRILHEEPNPEMAPDELWEILESHLDLWGNFYGYMVKDSDGLLEQLWPLSPSRVSVSRNEAGAREFWIEGEPFTEDTILHIRGLSLDGLVGYSPIQLARNSLGVAKAQEKFQGEFIGSEGKPSVILSHPNKLQPDAATRLKASWDSVKSGGTAVLEEGIKVERWTMPLEDAQFIEQMEFSDKRIAQMFLLQPGRLGAKSGDSLTYATTESEAREFVTFTLGRRLQRIEGSFNREKSLFPVRSKYAEFQRAALLQANQKERYEAYEIGTRAGFLTSEDIRPKENLPEREITAPPPPAPVPPSPPLPSE